MVCTLRKVAFWQLTLICFFAAFSSAAASTKLIFLPFDGSSAGRYSYLTDSITTMVASRIASSGDIEIVDYSLNKSELAQLRKLSNQSETDKKNPPLQGDYLVSGGLYEMQAGLYIQVSLVSLQTKGKTENFSTNADAENKIIPAVEEISHLIADNVHARVRQPEKIVEKDLVEKGTSGFATEHPDKSYKKGVTSGEVVSGSEGSEISMVSVKKSSPLDDVIVSMAIGDVDNDGHDEILVASKTQLKIFRFVEEQFRLEGQYSFRPDIKIHVVNLGDLDGKQGMEIYVSANEHNKPSSAILTWNKTTGFYEKLKSIPWLIRPVKKPKSSSFLIGQKGNDDPEKGYVGDTVYRLEVDKEGKNLHDVGTVSLPKQVGLFDFEWADLDGSGSLKTVAIDTRLKLMVFDEKNALLWISKDDYGGSRNFIGPSLASDKSLPDNGVNRSVRFVPARLVVKDVDGDGADNVLVSRNNLVSTLWLKNTREFDGGSVACLAWKDSAFHELWKTASLSGYVADYGLIDSQGDKRKTTDSQQIKLVIGQIPYKAILGLMMKENTILNRYVLKLNSHTASP